MSKAHHITNLERELGGATHVEQDSIEFDSSPYGEPLDQDIPFGSELPEGPEED